MGDEFGSALAVTLLLVCHFAKKIKIKDDAKKVWPHESSVHVRSSARAMTEQGWEEKSYDYLFYFVLFKKKKRKKERTIFVHW